MLTLALFDSTPPEVPWYIWPSRALLIGAWLLMLIVTLGRIRRPLRLSLFIMAAGVGVLLLASTADALLFWQYAPPFVEHASSLDSLRTFWNDPAMRGNVPALGAILLALGYFFAWPPRHDKFRGFPVEPPRKTP